MFKYIAGLIVLILLFTGWYITGLNRIVRIDESANQAFKEIENQMQRRYDLIPNLVSTVKGYAKHESELFTHIADARAALGGAKTATDKIKAYKEMDSLVSRLLVVVENYPNLKANENFARLMDELSGTENRMTVARMRYNEQVKIFNTYIREVLGSFFAKRKGLTTPKPYYEITEKAKTEVPKVEL